MKPLQMKLIFYGILILTGWLIAFSVGAQSVRELTREQSETIFLQENLLLLAERLNISKAEAQVVQAKLWPNPTFSIDQVNLWRKGQPSGEGDLIPPMFGDFGRNQAFGIEVEQLIQTAGKRKKLIALERVSTEMVAQYFEDVLRNLKLEFRHLITELQYYQHLQVVYQHQLESVGQLTRSYERQLERGNITREVFIRLRALELELSAELNELNRELNSVENELNLLMGIAVGTRLKITNGESDGKSDRLKSLTLTELIEQAFAQRPDYQLSILGEDYSARELKFEKAQRAPNLALKGQYDRGGNIMLDFVGFGVALDLPIFNRNQGNIKRAQIASEQASYLHRQKRLRVSGEVALAYQNLLNAAQFLERIDEGYEGVLDELLIRYTENFAQRNISLIEYLDFAEAYIKNKQIILDANKELAIRSEELNYAVGADVIK